MSATMKTILIAAACLAVGYAAGKKRAAGTVQVQPADTDSGTMWTWNGN